MTGIALGSINVPKIALGNTEIAKVSLGTVDVWPANVGFKNIASPTATAVNNAVCPMPSGAGVGDVVLFIEQTQQSSTPPVETYPAGFTKFADSKTSVFDSLNGRICFSYKILDASDLSRTLSGMSGVGVTRIAILVSGYDENNARKPIGSINVLANNREYITTKPSNQQINASSDFDDALLFAHYGTTSNPVSSAGWSGTAAPVLIGTSNGFAFTNRLVGYSGIPIATISMNDDGSMNSLSSFLIQFKP